MAGFVTKRVTKSCLALPNKIVFKGAQKLANNFVS